MKLPHPIVLLGCGVLLAAVLTWVLPAGEFDRRDDPASGRRVAVAGTYHRVAGAPVGPFAAAVAIPRGIVAAGDVIVVVLLAGGAWSVIDRLGTLPAVVDALVEASGGHGLWIIALVSIFFATMGALENMQEEIIALIPVLLALAARIGVDAVVVVAMSAGAAMLGSAFGPTNPFQAGIALKLAELPLMSASGLRLAMLLAGLTIWIAWTIRYARSLPRAERVIAHGAGATAAPQAPTPTGFPPISMTRHALIFLSVLAPMAAYVYGALRLDWGFNELSGAFVVGTIAAGVLGGLSVGRTVVMYLEGMQALLPAALLVGVARGISLVLTDGRVIDTILAGLVAPLSRLPPLAAATLMVPVHALVHVVVPSVSSQAVLTMPLVVPLADVLGLSRQVPVIAYQTGAGLTEFLTPTNGGLMAVLLAAGVPFDKWLRFAAAGVLLLGLVGLAGLAAAI